MPTIENGFPGEDQAANFPSGPRIISARDFIRKANAALAGHDLSLARECLRAALAFQPEDTGLLMALGHVEFGLGYYETALERYHVVSDMEPRLVEALSSQALTLQLLQRSREARLAAKMALALEPADLISLKVMARISLDTGHHNQARDFCRRILNACPGDQEALILLDQCRFDMEAFLAEDVESELAREKTFTLMPPHFKEEPRLSLHGSLPPPLESVLIKFPG